MSKNKKIVTKLSFLTNIKNRLVPLINVIDRHDKIYMLIFLLLIASIFSFISIYKHLRFETFGWDLAFQDQLIWKWSNFKISYMSMKDNINSLGDHFTLTWLFLVPLYWIYSDPKTLLAAQSFVAVFAAFPLYLLSKQVLNSRIISFSIVLMYVLFVSLQHSVFNDVHSTVFTTIFISSCYLFIEKRNWPAYWLSALGLAYTKEEFGLLVAAIGIVLILKRISFKHGLISIIFGFLNVYFLTVYLMPFAALTPKFVHAEFGSAGQSVSQVIIHSLTNPSYAISSFTDNPLKVDTFIKYFSSFGFLPLFSPIDLVPILQQIFVRFIDSYHPVRWRADNHYSAPLAILPALSFIQEYLS